MNHPSDPSQNDARQAGTRPIVFGTGRIANRTHVADILRHETVGGFLMMGATVLALLVANLAPSFYHDLTHLQLGALNLHGWVADGLLTIFFFVVGMELKREFVEGSLSRPADALLPIMAAVGGMTVPALIYVAVNAASGGSMHGWAIPMATDIAFALAVLAIVGKHLPQGLRAFLLTLAIVDDLGAIAIIAIFYAGGLQWLWLAAALACIAVFWALQRKKVDTIWLLIPLGLVAWWCMLQSGVHATIAGVAFGLATRTHEYEMNDPIDRWRHALEPWSAGLVVPLFAFVSAGVSVAPEALRGIIEHPEPLGVLLGLALGKFIGVYTASRLAVSLTKAELAEGVFWRDVAAVSVLTGIGFTVSLLISELAFTDHPEITDQAKAAVLIASTLCAVAGGVLLRRRSNTHAAMSS